MNHDPGDPVVLTLDAGGTNFTFSAMQADKRITDHLTLPAEAKNLERSLANLFEGFERIGREAGGEFSAISFSFPGPADYSKGVIDNVGNLPAYSGGVPLAEILKQRFNVPVFIRNDGDLFAYGEAMGGLLPEVNRKLVQSGSDRQYRNLIGLTLGTGFGGGMVIDGRLLQGDNSLSGEVWLLPHGLEPGLNAEEGISIRAITNCYVELASDSRASQQTPFDIAQIAFGETDGDEGAARKAFARFGESLGAAIATVVTLFDGMVVIGGGLSAAHRLFMPAALSYVSRTFSNDPGSPPRLIQGVFDLTDEDSSASFLDESSLSSDRGKKVSGVPCTPLSERKIPIGISSLGTSRAVSLGAYMVAKEYLSN